MASSETNTGVRTKGGAVRLGVNNPGDDDGADGSRSGSRPGATAPRLVSSPAVDPDGSRSSARRPGAVTTNQGPTQAVDPDPGRSSNKAPPGAAQSPVTRTRRSS